MTEFFGNLRPTATARCATLPENGLPPQSENFALTVPEALGCALPEIAFTATLWSGLVDHQCDWWVETDVDSLASALDEAMRMPQAALREMGERGRTLIERDFTWDVVAGRMRAVYDWLAGRGYATQTCHSMSKVG